MTFQIRKSASLLAAVGAIVLLGAQSSESWAQTASDVVCVRCVDASDIAIGAVTGGKIGNNAVSKNKIQNGAVKARHIAPNQVTSGKILDGTVTGADIANETITQSDLQTNSVNVSEIVSGAVRSDEVLNNSLLGIDIQDNTITSADVQNNSLSGVDILDNSVASADVTNNSLADFDMVDEAGADFVDGDGSLTLPAGPSIIRSVSITRPTSGVVIVNASGHWAFISTGADGARCSISTGTTVDFAHLMIGNDFGSTAGSNDFMPFASTRAFNFTTAGTSTFRLVCEEFEGNVRVQDGSINAIFVPTRY